MILEALAVLMNGTMIMLRAGGSAGSFPRPLKAAEEREYLERSAKGDAEARNKLIEHNLRLVAHIIKKYYAQADDQDDLISIGTIGLIKGVASFDVSKGARLTTYASRCIENEILMYFRSLRKTAGEVSLSDSIDTDKDGNSLSLMDVISVSDDMLDNIEYGENLARLRRYMREALTETEAKILKMRYGLDGGKQKTQREIAECCGISRSYVSRIEKRGIEKLKAKFACEDEN